MSDKPGFSVWHVVVICAATAAIVAIILAVALTPSSSEMAIAVIKEQERQAFRLDEWCAMGDLNVGRKEVPGGTLVVGWYFSTSADRLSHTITFVPDVEGADPWRLCTAREE